MTTRQRIDLERPDAQRGARPFAIPVILFAGLSLLLVARGDAQSSLTWERVHRPVSTPPGEVPGAFQGDGGYHSGDTLLCSDCHSVHYSQQHTWDGTGTVSTTGAPNGDWLGAGGPYPMLLKAPSATELCLECHDGKTFAPDVVGIDTNGLALRSAGHFEGLEVWSYRGHNLSATPEAGTGRNELCRRCHFGGDMATARVKCTDCHNKHGNVSFRNVQWASDPGAEAPIGAYMRPGVTGLDRYEADNVGYPAPTPGNSSYRELSNMCIDCHHSNFGSFYTGEDSPFIRHPGTNTEEAFYAPINGAGANTDPAAWVAGTGFLVPRLKFAVVGATDFFSATTVAANNEVFCLTCHQAHGSLNPFALRWDYGTPTDTGASGCYQCHRNVYDE